MIEYDYEKNPHPSARIRG